MTQKKKEVDPSALGLFGLALATLVASSEKLGLTHGLTYILPWVLFLGGIAQFIAGIYDYKKGNVFGATAFLAYGLFWLSVSFTWAISFGILGERQFESLDNKQLGFAFLGYLIFTLYMTIGSMETNKILFTIFLFIIVLFLGLTLSSFGVMTHNMKVLSGVAELIISILSFYASAANILNIHFEKNFLPVGKSFGIFK